MALKANVEMIFDSYEVVDEGIEMRFMSPDPGAGQESYLTILLTDAELATVSSQSQLATLIRTKLERRIRAAGIASKLDPFIGQSMVIT